MARLMLVRHGQTDHNTDRRVAGYTDVTLNEEGIRQVKKLGERLTNETINVVYCSDLQRTVDTAEGAIAGRDIEIIRTPVLREMNFGEAEEMTFQEINEKFPDIAGSVMNFAAGLSFPGGETFAEFANRACGILDTLAEYKEDETVLIVSHGGTIKVLLCGLLDIDQSHWYQFGIDNASLTIVNTYGNRTILNLLNDTTYLSD